MISTSTRRLEPPRTDDGGLLDPSVRRRSERLSRAGVGIERRGTLAHVVTFPDGGTRRFRTSRSAELAAHSYLDDASRGAGPR